MLTDIIDLVCRMTIKDSCVVLCVALFCVLRCACVCVSAAVSPINTGRILIKLRMEIPVHHGQYV